MSLMRSKRTAAMRTTVALFLMVLLLAALSGGCSSREVKQPGFGIAAPPYHQNTLYNFYLSRTYMSEGRYELAKQRLLLAMTTAEDPEMRARLAQEVEAVDKMIQTMR